MPPDLKLSNAVLAALGLIACTDDASKDGETGPCLSFIEESYIGPCLETDWPCLETDWRPPDSADTDTVDTDFGPCLEAADTTGNFDTETVDTDPVETVDTPPDTDTVDTDLGETDVGPCLSPPFDTDTVDTDIGPCLSPPLDTDTVDTDTVDTDTVDTDPANADTGDTYNPGFDTRDTAGACLTTPDTSGADTAPPETDLPTDSGGPIPAPRRPAAIDGGASAGPRDAARDRVLGRGVLPDDLTDLIEQLRQRKT